MVEVILTVAKERTNKKMEQVKSMLALLERETDDDDDAEATLGKRLSFMINYTFLKSSHQK